MEKSLLGGKRKAKDDQSTCTAEKSMPKSSKYNCDVYFGFRDLLIPWRRILMWHLSERSSEYEAKQTKTTYGNEVMQTSLTNLDALYQKR
jgi:hypothetical protein